MRLLFPTLQRNESPFSILAPWLGVLGKKIDSAAGVQDTDTFLQFLCNLIGSKSYVAPLVLLPMLGETGEEGDR